MKRAAFLQRLRDGSAVGHQYRAPEGQAGQISLWKHEGRIVLTWEECRDGDQFNENRYTRDEIHHFDTAEEALSFVEASGFNPEKFTG